MYVSATADALLHGRSMKLVKRSHDAALNLLFSLESFQQFLISILNSCKCFWSASEVEFGFHFTEQPTERSQSEPAEIRTRRNTQTTGVLHRCLENKLLVKSFYCTL